jgi:hypothetical protein
VYPRFSKARERGSVDRRSLDLFQRVLKVYAVVTGIASSRCPIFLADMTLTARGIVERGPKSIVLRAHSGALGFRACQGGET